MEGVSLIYYYNKCKTPQQKFCYSEKTSVVMTILVEIV